MTLDSLEHDEIMAEFEKVYKHMRLDRETDRELWKKSRIYQSGETNALFLAYRWGYALGRCNYLNQ